MDSSGTYTSLTYQAQVFKVACQKAKGPCIISHAIHAIGMKDVFSMGGAGKASHIHSYIRQVRLFLMCKRDHLESNVWCRRLYIDIPQSVIHHNQ